jgi:hypothetical protein
MITLGQSVLLISAEARYETVVAGLELFKFKPLEAGAGENVCLVLADVPQGVITRQFRVINEKTLPYS